MPRRAGNERRKTPRVGKRYPLNLRTTFDIRAKLESAAVASGRSLAQEVEYRLERSFERQDLLQEVLTLAFGDEIAEMLIDLREDGVLALNNPDREKVLTALNSYFDKHLPAGAPEEGKP